MSHIPTDLGDILSTATTIPTAEGDLELSAVEHGDRWLVRARCGSRLATGIGPDPGSALQAAYDLYEHLPSPQADDNEEVSGER